MARFLLVIHYGRMGLGGGARPGCVDGNVEKFVSPGSESNWQVIFMSQIEDAKKAVRNEHPDSTFAVVHQVLHVPFIAPVA